MLKYAIFFIILLFFYKILPAQVAYIDTAYEINGYTGNQSYYSVKFSDDKYVLICYGATTTLIIDLIAINARGDTLWTKNINIDSITPSYFIYHAATDSNSCILIAGTAYIDSVQGDMAMMIKCDSSGNLIWVKTYGNSIYGEYGGLFGFTPVITIDNHYLLVCQVGITGYNTDFLIVKTDTAGNEQSRWQYGTPHEELPWTGMQTSDSGFLFAGYTSKDDTFDMHYEFYSIYVIKADKNGNMLWQMSYPQGYDYYHELMGEGQARGLLEDQDGYIICGEKPNIDNSLLYWTEGIGPRAWDKCWLGKVNKSDGSLIWEKYYGPDSLLWYADFYDIKWTPDSNFILVNNYQWDNFYDNSSGFFKIDRNGDSLWSIQFNYDNNLDPGVYLYSVNTIGTEGYLSAGYLSTNNTVDSDFAWIVTIDSNGCAANQCVATGITQIPPTGGASLNIYPNPASNQLLISATGFLPQTTTIYNLNGQQLINLPFAREVDISTLPPGVYFVEVTGTQATEVRKLVKAP